MPETEDFHLLVIQICHKPILIIQLDTSRKIFINILQISFFQPGFRFRTSQFHTNADNITQRHKPLIILITPVPMLTHHIHPYIPPHSVF